MLGVKGVFIEGDAQIAASFASSTYEVPQVLLEIGAAPPTYPFTDRSRVSITFDESAKYGITWSQDSVIKDSLMSGYAGKRARYSPFLAEVNNEIARTHDDYGAVEDDTVFFWGMSAFVNKQVVRNSFKLMHRFGLNKADAFKQPRLVMGLVSLFKDPASQLFYAVTGEPLGRHRRAHCGRPVAGVRRFDPHARQHRHLSLAGGNAVEHPELPLRAAQFPEQRAAGHAQRCASTSSSRLASARSIISELATFGAGCRWRVARIRGAAGRGRRRDRCRGRRARRAGGHQPALPGPCRRSRLVDRQLGAAARGAARRRRDHALRVPRHPGVPGRDRLACVVPEVRVRPGRRTAHRRRTTTRTSRCSTSGTSARRGSGCSGRSFTRAPEGSTAEPEEGYVGVFSNERPEWLTKESDPYDHRLERGDREGHGDKNLEGCARPVRRQGLVRQRQEHLDRPGRQQNRIRQLRDVHGPSVLGPGARGRHRRPRVHVRRSPPGRWIGSAARSPTATTPSSSSTASHWRPTCSRASKTRSFAAAWSSGDSEPTAWSGTVTRCCTIFPTARHPVRQEAPERETRRRGDDRGAGHPPAHRRRSDGGVHRSRPPRSTSVASGPPPSRWSPPDRSARTPSTMPSGSSSTSQSGAARTWCSGSAIRRRAEIPPDLSFLEPSEIVDLDPSVLLGPLSLLGEGGTPEWEASFSLKALMGDHRLRDCVVPFSQLNFEGDRRQSGPRPFSVRLAAWADWAAVGGAIEIGSWLLAAHPPHSSTWHDHHDLFAVDRRGRLWHRRTTCGGTMGFWRELDASRRGARLDIAVLVGRGQRRHWSSLGCSWFRKGGYWPRASDPDGGWSQPWADLRPMVAGTCCCRNRCRSGRTLSSRRFRGLVRSTERTCTSRAATARSISVVVGSRGDLELWQHLDTAEFDLASQSPLRVVGRQIVALSQQGELWIRDLEQVALFGGGWQKVDSPGFAVHGLRGRRERRRAPARGTRSQPAR